jgi:hypothetical protein
MVLYPSPAQHGQTVRTSFDQLLQMQTQGHNMKLCATCKCDTPRVATERITIPDELRYLIIYLNRFGNDRHHFPVKIANFSSTNQVIYSKITDALNSNQVVKFLGHPP